MYQKSKTRPEYCTFFKKNRIEFDISYSDSDIEKSELLEAIKDDKSCMSDLQDTYNAVVEKHYNVHICSGSGFIVNMGKGKIEFTITAGGKIFDEVPYVVNELKKKRDKNFYCIWR